MHNVICFLQTISSFRPPCFCNRARLWVLCEVFGWFDNMLLGYACLMVLKCFLLSYSCLPSHTLLVFPASFFSVHYAHSVGCSVPCSAHMPFSPCSIKVSVCYLVNCIAVWLLLVLFALRRTPPLSNVMNGGHQLIAMSIFASFTP